MPRKKEKLPLPPVAELPEGAQQWLDQVVTGPMTAGAVEEVMRGIKKALIERALQAELSRHLGYAEGEAKPEASANQRNGTSGKTVLTDDGPLRIDVPGDRAGQFEPQLIGKHERRFTGFDDKIIAMYARGMSVREIQAYLLQMYHTDVSADFISQVTDAVMDEVREWQSRPLEAVYPVVFFDALRVKIREDAVVRNKAHRHRGWPNPPGAAHFECIESIGIQPAHSIRDSGIAATKVRMYGCKLA